MAWKKKFPGIAAGLAGVAPAPQAPTQVPGAPHLGTPAEPSVPAASGLISNPDKPPQMPKFSGSPNIHEEIKRRALANIASGKKGF